MSLLLGKKCLFHFLSYLPNAVFLDSKNTKNSAKSLRVFKEKIQVRNAVQNFIAGTGIEIIRF
ncbi:MAG TPA: hypothetical protein VKX40_03755 [Aequorivita sp.]|nr:hypothetical protein [Aequorivita sp.]